MYEAKDEHMTCYLTLVEDHLAKLGEWIVERVPQTKNLKADSLAGIVATFPIEEVVLLSIYFQTMSSIVLAPIYSTTKLNTD